ncbi:hypothetical protein H4219_002052 [Mycoemilia scoparia]|uniref:Uncharacterized protein n=1 Tax=Mycoemilia scoparia TaxID=417184 RepID=A0A9W7ZYP4_9FUNG|nr:hypothetical protein H4219_002052 [Mycoemilia scoparia]
MKLIVSYKKVKKALLTKARFGKHSANLYGDVEDFKSDVVELSNVTPVSLTSSDTVPTDSNNYSDKQDDSPDEEENENSLQTLPKRLSIDTTAFGCQQEKGISSGLSIEGNRIISNYSKNLNDDDSDIWDIGYFVNNLDMNVTNQDHDSNQVLAEFDESKYDVVFHNEFGSEGTGLDSELDSPLSMTFGREFALKSTSIKGTLLYTLAGNRKDLFKISRILICSSDSLEDYTCVLGQLEKCCENLMYNLAENSNQFAREYQNIKSKLIKATFGCFLIIPVVVSMIIDILESVLPVVKTSHLHVRTKSLKKQMMLCTLLISAIMNGDNMCFEYDSRSYILTPQLVEICNEYGTVLSFSSYLPKRRGSSPIDLYLDLLIHGPNPNTLFVKTAEESFTRFYDFENLPNISSMLLNQNSSDEILFEFSDLLNSNFGNAFTTATGYSEANELINSICTMCNPDNYGFSNETPFNDFDDKTPQGFSLSVLFK